VSCHVALALHFVNCDAGTSVVEDVCLFESIWSAGTIYLSLPHRCHYLWPYNISIVVLMWVGQIVPRACNYMLRKGRHLHAPLWIMKLFQLNFKKWQVTVTFTVSLSAKQTNLTKGNWDYYMGTEMDIPLGDMKWPISCWLLCSLYIAIVLFSTSFL
jgi:hypothetical protein